MEQTGLFVFRVNVLCFVKCAAKTLQITNSRPNFICSYSYVESNQRLTCSLTLKAAMTSPGILIRVTLRRFIDAVCYFANQFYFRSGAMGSRSIFNALAPEFPFKF